MKLSEPSIISVAIGWVLTILLIGACTVYAFKIFIRDEEFQIWKDQPLWFNLVLLILMLLYSPFRYMIWQGAMTLNLAAQSFTLFFLVFASLIAAVVYLIGIPYIIWLLAPAFAAVSIVRSKINGVVVKRFTALIVACVFYPLSTKLFFWALPFFGQISLLSMMGGETEIIEASQGSSWTYYKYVASPLMPINHPNYISQIGDDPFTLYINHVAYIYMSKDEHKNFVSETYPEIDVRFTNLKKPLHTSD